MNLRHLRGFVTVAQVGSIRGAARELGVTQPAVTKAIQQLEVELGAALLQRNVKGVTLTPYGVAFLTRARLVVAELGRARDELAQLTQAFAGTVSIGLAPTIAELLAPKVVEPYLRRHPQVKLRMVGGLPTSTVTRVADGTLDFVIGPRPVVGVPASIDSWPLYSVEVAITMRAGHPLAGARSLAELADADWVLTQSAANPDGPLTQAFQGLGLEGPKCRLQSESFVAALSTVAQTDFVSLMPCRAVQLGLLHDRLTIARVPELAIQNSIELFFRREAPMTPAAFELAKAFQGTALAMEGSLGGHVG